MTSLKEHLQKIENNEWCAQTFVMTNYSFHNKIKKMTTFLLFSGLFFFLESYPFLLISAAMFVLFSYQSYNLYFNNIIKKNKLIADLINCSSAEIYNYLNEMDSFTLSLDKNIHQPHVIRLMHNEIEYAKFDLTQKNIIHKNYISRIRFTERLVRIKNYQKELNNY